MAFDFVSAYAIDAQPFYVVGQPAPTLSQAPQQITLRFSNGIQIDPSSLDKNITVVRSGLGGDGFGVAGTKTDVAIDASLSIDDAPNQNQVVIRFKDTLPDDSYQITIGAGLKSLAQGTTPADSVRGPLSFAFRLDLGAYVVSVVPQPVSRVGGVLTQSASTIEVYFNRNDPLSKASAEATTAYRLFKVDPTTGADVAPLAPANPTTVIFDAASGKATLTFAPANLAADKLYRLQIGSAEQLLGAVAPVTEGSDDNSSFATSRDLGQLGVGGATVTGSISVRPVVSTPVGALGFPSQPGSVDEPGHRDTPADSGSYGAATQSIGAAAAIAVQEYNFQDVYGKDPQGNDLHNAITETQKERAREIFEIYSRYTGIRFVETASSGITVVTGDLRAVDPTVSTAPSGIAGIGLAIMDATENWGNSEYAGYWFQVAMHEIGHVLGLQHSYDLPSIMGKGLTGENVFPGDYDTIQLAQLYPANGSDIDVFKFTLPVDGTLTAETVVARPGQPVTSGLDSLLTLYREVGGKREMIARNDDSSGRDSFIGLDLAAGTYYIAVTSTGNDKFNPEVNDSGYGGRTDGAYQLKLGFQPTSTAATTIVDASGTLLDGDRDGKAGGAFNFWFNTASTANTVFVDRVAAAGGSGSLASPYNTIQDALANAAGKTLIRIVGNDTNTPYLVGTDLAGRALRDGSTFNVPAGVTVMIDAGAIFKLRAAVIDVGSSSPLVSRAGAALQVLGTPDKAVTLTSYHDDDIGGDSDGFGPTRDKWAGSWGGVVLRSDSDSASKKAFVNSISGAQIRYGGGQVLVDSVLDSFAPVQLESTRPTIAFNTITDSAGAAISAAPNSFEESSGRSGPEIRGNRLVETRKNTSTNLDEYHQNSINGLFVKIRTDFGSPIDTLDVPARFKSTDIVYVLQENLLVNGGVGGYDATSGVALARQSGRLTIDPGVVVKLQGARIELERGTSELTAEGTAGQPVIFTSLGDNRFGAGGTFDTNGPVTNKFDAFGRPFGTLTTGDWGGIVLDAVSKASIDHAYIAFGGGQTPIEGGFDQFNVIEVHQGDLRLAHSRIEKNAAGTSTGDRDGRGTNAAATVFVRGAQPVILGNDFRDNLGAVVSINANSLTNAERPDPGRTTGRIDRDSRYDDNLGPLVRDNRLSYTVDAASGRPAGGATLGMQVRGEETTVQSVWDDADMVHVLQNEIIVQNFNTSTGVRLMSQPNASLVVKLAGPNAGFTAAGYGLDINDRIGGVVQVVGQASYPVVLTSLKDDSVGASLDPLGLPVKDVNTDGSATAPAPGDWRSLKFLPYSNDRNVSVVLERELAAIAGTDVNSTPAAAQTLGVLAPDLKSGDDNRRLGFQVQGRIATDAPGDVDVYSFTGYAGTEVWLDLDKTSPGLDTMIELLDASGRVLALSADGQTDAALAVAKPGVRGLGNDLQKDGYNGGDYWSVNPKDPGMRVVLPGAAGQSAQYYVRVRSQPRYDGTTTGMQYANDLTDPTKLAAGQTTGRYELNIRLQQRDEVPGSTVRYADIRFPMIGIDVQGLPNHSPLTGETGENPTDTTSATSANPLASAQYVGNLLQSDQNTISIAGAIANAADVDWYTFALNYEEIQSIAGVNDGTKTWATMFDIDYGDGVRGDLTISVFDSTGKLIYTGRDSNVASDQPPAGGGSGISDLSRGSLGVKDPFIGSVQLPAGNPTGSAGIESGASAVPPDPTKQLRYYVAVSSNERLPAVLDATFKNSATNSLVRLEPVNSVQRIVEDHIGTNGYTSGPSGFTTTVQPTTLTIIDVSNAISLSTHVTPFTLSDVTLYVANSTSLFTVDAMRGNTETTVSNTNGTNDLVMRSDGQLYGYRRLANTANTAGTLDLIDSGTGARTNIGNDSIPNAPAVTPVPATDTNVASTTTGVLVSTTAFTLANRNLTAGSVNGVIQLQYTDNSVIPAVNYRGSWAFSFDNAGAFVLGSADPANTPGIAAPKVLGSSLNRGTGVVTIAWTANVPPSAASLQTVSYTYDPDPNAVTTDNVDAMAWNYTTTTSPATNALFYSVREGATKSRLYKADPNTGSAATGRIGGQGGYIQTAGNDLGLTTGMAFLNGTLYGVDDRGNLFTISTGGTGNLATLIATIPGAPSFSGLALGPQNLQNGFFADKLFAIDTNGLLYCLDTAGNLQTVFDSNNDGGADATSIATTVLGATGLAFSPLDINLWHPTTRRSSDDGHGINVAPDNTRDGTTLQTVVDGQGISRTSAESKGGVSMYFGLEQYVRPGAPTPYLNYQSYDGQYGVLDGSWQQDLSSNSAIPNTYNLPGGAYGSLTTGSFSLAGYGYNDKPTIYFNYFLQTQNASGAYNQNLMRDSARVFISKDAGLTWEVIATNNSARSAIDTTNGELPAFASASSSISTMANQNVQELYDSASWRQARIDLGKYAGQGDLRLRFDFSTAGEFDATQRNTAGALVNPLSGFAGTTGNFNSAERGQNNQYEGFYVDDIIVGFAERGEMVTGATAGQTDFFNVATPTGATIPQQVLAGAYQLEMRRGTEYGQQPVETKSDVAIFGQLDTNADLVVANDLLGDANNPRSQGQFLIDGNIVTNAATYGISIDAGVRDAGTQAPVPGVPRNFPTLNNSRLVPGVVVTNNVLASNGTGGILFSGDPNTGNVPLAAVPYGRIVNNTIYGGSTAAGVGIAVTENAGPTILNNVFANLATGVSVDGTSAANTVIGTSAYSKTATQVSGASQSQQVTIPNGLNPFVNAAGRNFYLAPGTTAIDSSLNTLQDRTNYTVVTSPLGIPASPIIAPDRDLYGQLRGDDPTQASQPGLGSNVFKDRGAIDRVDFTQPYASIVTPVGQGVTSPTDLDPSSDNVQLQRADARGITKFELQLTDVGVGIDKATVIAAAFTLSRDGNLLTNGVDYTFTFLESSNRVVFYAASVFQLGAYVIEARTPQSTGTAGVTADLAGNTLLPNQSNGTLLFNILLQDVPTAPTSLVAVPGAAQVSLSWTPSTSSGSPLLRYELQHSLTGDFTVATTTNVAPTAASYVVNGLVNATQYWFRIRAVNAIGVTEWSNVAGPVVPLRVPTIALTVDTGFSATDGITSDGRVTVGSLEGGATWQWRVNAGAWTPGVGTSFTLPVGTYPSGSVEVRQAIGGSTSSAGSNAVQWIVDTVAPVQPLAPAEQGTTKLADGRLNAAEAATSTTFRVALGTSGAVAGDSVALLLGGSAFSTPKTVVLTATNITNGYVDFSVSGADLGVDGFKSLTARVTDRAGNVGAAGPALTFTKDTVSPNAPAAPIEQGTTKLADGRLNAVEAATATTIRVGLGTSGAAVGDNVELLFNGVSFPQSKILAVTAARLAAGYVDFSVTGANLGIDGWKSLTARVLDPAGNPSAASTALTFTKDTVAPNAPGAPSEQGTTKLVDGRLNAVEAATATMIRVGLGTSGAVVGDNVELLLNNAGFSVAKILAVTAARLTAGYVDFSVTASDLGADGSKSLTARVTDVVGNVGAASSSLTFIKDTLAAGAPAAPIEQGTTKLADGRLNAAESASATTFRVGLGTSGAVAGDTVELLIGGLPFSTAKRVVLTDTDVTSGYVDFTVNRADLGIDGSKSLTARVTDLASNVGAASSAVTFALETVSPTVVNVTSSLADGIYGVGQAIPVQLVFTEPVFVTGFPTLALNTTPARTATYLSGSGTNTLIFRYITQVGDSASRLDYVATTSLTLNGGTLRDAAGNDAVRTLVTPGTAGSLGANKAIAIAGALQASASGFGTTSPGPAFTTTVTVVPIKFNAVVTGFSLASMKLYYEGREVSLAGASISGSGSTYTLTLAPTTASLKGQYRLDIGGPGSGIVAGSVAMNTISSIFWQRV